MNELFQRTYAVGTGSDVYIGLVKAATSDLALGADWTPAAGDVKVSKDGGTAANIATLPTAVAMGNGAQWKFVFSNAELTCKILTVTVADSAAKAVVDYCFLVETKNNASAQHPGVYVAVDGIIANSISTPAYTALGESVAGSVFDAFTVDHSTAGTFGLAIGAGSTATTEVATDTDTLITNLAAAKTVVDSILSQTGTSGVKLAADAIDAILDDPVLEPGGVPTWPSTPRLILGWLLALGRNKATETATLTTLRNDADSANLGTAITSTTSGTYTRGEWT